MPINKKKSDEKSGKDVLKQSFTSPLMGRYNERPSLSYMAVLFLLYVALPSFTLSVFLLLRFSSPLSAYWAAMTVLFVIIYYFRDKIGIGGCLAFFGILIACHVYAYFGFDGSYDGFTYQQPAVRRIVNGFNPVYDGYMSLGRPADHWSDQATYFPKALWYFSATVIAAFGDIQIGKVYNLLLILAALFFVVDTTKNEHIIKRALWATACLNPIALTQIPYYLADGAISSLSTISLFYAYLFFNDRPITRFQHLFCIVALSMLFCVKTSGFGFGSIIIFFIVLNDFVKRYREGFATAFSAAFKLGLRIGLPVALLVLVLGFAPYATNLLNNRHIFHNLMGSESSNWVQTDAEKRAEIIYPNANNRFTRLLYSIASHTVITKEPAKLKYPFDFSLSDWEAFSQSTHMTAAGLGPFFCLFLLISVIVPLIFGFRGNGWLLLTLLTLIFIQPYSWIMRFAPFLWIVPLACLMSLPEKKGFYVLLPLSIAYINIFGVSYYMINGAWQYYYQLNRVCSTFAGEIVMLPQSIFEYHGIFDRFGIRQKYVNPEETNFYVENVNFGSLPDFRRPDGVNIFLKRHLPPLPESSIVFADNRSTQWIRMSDGLRPFETIGPNYSRVTEWLTYKDKVKFYMSLDREPKEDWELTLKGSVFDTTKETRELKILVFINNREIGTWQVVKNTGIVTFTIPKELMEESFKDEVRLFTLMLQLQREAPTYGLKIEEMRINEKRLQ